MSKFKFDIGDRVHLNETAYAALPERNKLQLPNTFRGTIFTVARRHQIGNINQYFIPGYDWQGGTGWVVESWLSKWCGDGPLRMSIAIAPEDDTLREVLEYEKEIRDQIYKTLGIPQRLLKIEFEHTEEPALELDKVAE